SLKVPQGSVFAVIGANGAGKSTLLGAIAGLHRPSRGRILLGGEDITSLSCPQRVAHGVSLVPEGRRLFPSLTVEENILAGAYRRRKGPWDLGRIYQMFEWMPARRSQSAAQLSGGEQHAVAIARALMANPLILLIDELSLGLAPIVVRGIYASLTGILESGLTIMLVEQDVAQACSVATGIHCLLEGRTTLEGGPRDFSSAEIEAAYFGMATTVGPTG
ncbi:MAG: ABC transporter ATP-binding protein, partial [Candidatus Dormibacteria bacterium]